MTYKRFTGYSPGVAVIGDLIVGRKTKKDPQTEVFAVVNIFTNITLQPLRAQHLP